MWYVGACLPHADVLPYQRRYVVGGRWYVGLAYPMPMFFPANQHATYHKPVFFPDYHLPHTIYGCSPHLPHTTYHIRRVSPTYRTPKVVNDHSGNAQTSSLSQRLRHSLGAQTAERFSARLLACA